MASNVCDPWRWPSHDGGIHSVKTNRTGATPPPITWRGIMIRRTLWYSLPGTPLTALAVHGIPWWGTIVLACLGPIAYICRLILLYRLANKALDKAPPTQMAAVMTAITGHGPTHQTNGRRLSPRRQPSAGG
jgi:hypothetical protein